MGERTYIAVDLKSFYAPVECMERGLDPMTTNLVVANESRTEKTICLAVTARLTEARIELDENAKAELDKKLRLLMEYLQEQPQVAITYFQPDSRKEGGAYLTVTGVIKRIRELERMVELMDGTRIPISDILDLESRVFKALESEYADDPPTMD